jgi:hypothetical protein
LIEKAAKELAGSSLKALNSGKSTGALKVTVGAEASAKTPPNPIDKVLGNLHPHDIRVENRQEQRINFWLEKVLGGMKGPTVCPIV